MPSRFSPSCRSTVAGRLSICCSSPIAHRQSKPTTCRIPRRRSRSMAFGSAMIEFGEDVSWDALVKESTATQRVNPLQLKLGPTTELGRFPAIPYEVAVAPDGIRRVPAVVGGVREGEAAAASRDCEAARDRAPQGSRAVRAWLQHQLRECRADDGRAVPFPGPGFRMRHLHVAGRRAPRHSVRLRR